MATLGLYTYIILKSILWGGIALGTVFYLADMFTMWIHSNDDEEAAQKERQRAQSHKQN